MSAVEPPGARDPSPTDRSARASLPILPALAETPTAPGNYFVSNYPPYSTWRAEGVPAALAALEQGPAADVALGLYAHIPFCRKRCHFCYFKVYTERTAADVRDYVRSLVAELAAYATKPFIGGRTPKFVYFGGGTPSYLSAEETIALTSEMQRLLPWDDVEEVTFEAEPGTLNAAKLEVLKRVGVTRLSLGIEHFDDEVLARNGRAHRAKEARRTLRAARDAGFPQINVDLIAGMVGDTFDGFRRAVDETLSFLPDSVTVYQMEVPLNTTLYREMKAEGREETGVASWETKRAWVGHAFAELERAGYRAASGYALVRGEARWIYRDELWSGADVIGLGVSAYGHVSGALLQNHRDIEDYRASVASGRFPLARAAEPTDEERLVREWVLGLKLGRVAFARYRQRFGVDVRARFAPALAALEARGMLTVDDDGVSLTRDGLLQVDALLPNFYLPRHRGVRYT